MKTVFFYKLHLISLQGEATNSGSGNSEDIKIEDLQKEIETLKKKIIEEREKLKDKTVVQVKEYYFL